MLTGIVYSAILVENAFGVFLQPSSILYLKQVVTSELTAYTAVEFGLQAAVDS
jgi:hypothetical protein